MKIKISIIGVGLMGLQHIKAIKKSKKALLHSIVTLDDNSTYLSKKFNVPLFKNIRESLIKNKPDAAIVATPNRLHKINTITYLKSKIPVLLEKPISDNFISAKKILDCSKINNTPLLMGFHRRYNSIVTKVKHQIDSGKLGKIVSANIMCWFYKHKEYYKYRWRIEKGGGPLAINLVHDIDLICYLLGPVKFVQAFTSNSIRKFQVEDTAIVNLIFYSGALCTLNLSDTIVAPWSYELTAGENLVYPKTNQSAYYIGGTKGSIQFPNINLWNYKFKRSWWQKISTKKENIRISNKTLINQIDHFCDVVLKKAKPKVNVYDGFASMKIFDAILKSAKTGKKVKI